VIDSDHRRGRVLVVEGEEAIATLVSTTLRLTGFEAAVAPDAATCLRAVPDFRPDLLILDVTLPDMDGFQLVERLQADGRKLSVMYLTARDSARDRVRGLRLGAEDYLGKPFDLEELLLRVEVVLRRRRAASVVQVPMLSYADLELDDATHEVRRGGVSIHLSPNEFRLLQYLLVNAEKVVSKAQIFKHVWRYEYAGNAQIVESYIHLLRKKVDTTDPRLIHTVRGFGYALRVPRTGT
jgi:two-component system, OmpR family, response regulator